jgi:hypothetical protein
MARKLSVKQNSVLRRNHLEGHELKAVSLYESASAKTEIACQERRMAEGVGFVLQITIFQGHFCKNAKEFN